MGVAGLLQRRRWASQIDVHGDDVTFRRKSGSVTVKASQIESISRPRWDVSRTTWLSFTTTTNGNIKASAHIDGLFDLLFELRRQNPGLRLERI